MDMSSVEATNNLIILGVFVISFTLYRGFALLNYNLCAVIHNLNELRQGK